MFGESFDDSLGGASLVEGVGSTFGDLAHDGRDVGVGPDLARPRGVAVEEEVVAGGSLLGEQLRLEVPASGDGGVMAKPCSAWSMAGWRTSARGMRPKRVTVSCQPHDGAGDGDAWGPCRSQPPQRSTTSEVERGGRAAAAIEGGDGLVGVVVEEGEAVSADAVGGGFDDSERGGGGDCGVAALPPWLRMRSPAEGGERLAGGDDAPGGEAGSVGTRSGRGVRGGWSCGTV